MSDVKSSDIHCPDHVVPSLCRYGVWQLDGEDSDPGPDVGCYDDRAGSPDGHAGCHAQTGQRRAGWRGWVSVGELRAMSSLEWATLHTKMYAVFLSFRAALLRSSCLNCVQRTTLSTWRRFWLSSIAASWAMTTQTAKLAFDGMSPVRICYVIGVCVNCHGNANNPDTGHFKLDSKLKSH